MTLKQIIDDVILRCYGGKPADDNELPRAQVLQWAKEARDGMVKDYLDLIIKNGNPIPTEYVIRETSLAASAEDLPDTEPEDERVYITLEKQPMSLLNDVAVIRVITEDGVMLNKSRSENIDWVKDLRYGKPTAKNPVWYRDNRKIILEGVSYKNLKTQYIVYYIPSAASQTLAETDELTISDELLDPLMARLEQMARMQMDIPADIINDGTDG